MTPRIPDTHAEAWALLPWVANGRIGAADREWVDAHLQGCDECRAELAAQRMLSTRMGRSDDAVSELAAADEQRSFDRLWARIEASEAIQPRGRATAGGTVAAPARRSRTVRWLAAAVIVQAIGLGVLGLSMRGQLHEDRFSTVTTVGPRTHAPAVRLVFAPQASIGSINTLLAHQGLSIVGGPGASGNFTAELSADAVASGASAESIAEAMSRDPNVTFAQPVAR